MCVEMCVDEAARDPDWSALISERENPRMSAAVTGRTACVDAPTRSGCLGVRPNIN